MSKGGYHTKKLMNIGDISFLSKSMIKTEISTQRNETQGNDIENIRGNKIKPSKQ